MYGKMENNNHNQTQKKKHTVNANLENHARKQRKQIKGLPLSSVFGLAPGCQRSTANGIDEKRHSG